MVTYEELRDIKKRIEEKHATSEHTREADVVVLTPYKEGYQRIQASLEETMKAWKPQVTFRRAKNACDAFWTRKGVAVFITDYFINADFSIFGPDPLGDLVARLYKEDENAIVAIVSPFFDDFSTHTPTYNEQKYLHYWTRQYYGRYWTSSGVGSPNDVSSRLNYAGFKSFGVDEKGLSALKLYIRLEINKR